RQLPVRPDRAENLVVLHLAGHHRPRHTFALQQLDGLAQFSQADPVYTLRGLRQLRRSLFLKRDYRHLDSLASRALQHEKRKSPVSRDQSPAFPVGIHFKIPERVPACDRPTFTSRSRAPPSPRNPSVLL